MGYGLALAGGGTRGAAHAGVLLALEEEKLLPDFIAGTSAGSLAAGCFASGMRAEELCGIVHHLAKHGMEYLDPDIKGLLRLIPQLLLQDKVALSGLLKGRRLNRYFGKVTGGACLETLSMALLIPAVDLLSGDTVCYTNRTHRIRNASVKEESVSKSEPALSLGAGGKSGRLVRWMTKGRLCDIMMASCSVPGVFRPMHMDGCCLVDGGVADNLPVDLMKAVGVKRIVAVDIGSDYEMPEDDSVFEILSHSFSIMSGNLKECHVRGETVLLKPELTKKAGLLTFDQMEACLEEAYRYTKRNAERIRKALQ